LTPSLIPLVILLILYLYLSFLSIIFLPFSLRPHGKGGDSEEDNDEEVVKQVVKRRFEERG
jgi:hypothetical protein